MKTLYIDCGMGAAGDMLTAALIELFPASEREAIVEELNNLGIPRVRYYAEKSVKCGITGTHISVRIDGEEEDHIYDHDHHSHHDDHHHHDHDHNHDEHDHDHDEHHEHDHNHDEHHEHDHYHDEHHEHDHHHDDHHEHDHHHDEHHHEEHHHHHHHASMHSIEHIIQDHLKVSEKVKKNILAVYGLIAEAESTVHGVPIEEIHFHEVGTMDAVADVTAVSYLLEKLEIGKIVVSPVHVGSGQVKCAHGILPVPAPATAYILKEAPIYGGQIKGELCTPTGAALLKNFASYFGNMPAMKVEAIGYGMGKKDFDVANCVRVMIGEEFHDENTTDPGKEEIIEMNCNVDDMTGEEIGFAMERLFEAGAKDVYTIPIIMKKNRPGTLIKVMCTEEDKDNIVKALFKHTTTIGIRENRMKRYILDRRMEYEDTNLGKVRCKISEGYGVTRKKYEYEDLANIALEKGCSIYRVREEL